MKNIKMIVYFITVVIVLSGCDLLESGSTASPELDSKILFKVNESYEPHGEEQEPKIFIDLYTAKTYPCFNYSIVTSHSVNKKQIEIELLAINAPEVCLTALGPARGRINLGYLDGGYEIIFKNREFRDNYNLIINDTLIFVDGEETVNTKPLTSFLHRYPENSFAYLYGSLDSLKYLDQKFRDTLTQTIKITEFTFQDFADIPYPLSSSGHHYDAPARYFYYDSEEDFDKIESILKSFLESYFSDEQLYSIAIINWKNVEIYSWMLN
jgi:hypothetical protein